MSTIEEFVARVGKSKGVRYCSTEEDAEMYLFEPTDVMLYK